MSEQNFIRRVCDYCNTGHNFTQAQMTSAEAAEVANWVTLVRVHIVNGQAHPVIKHACKDSCASNIISLGMLGLPKEITDMLEEQKKRAELAKNGAANSGASSTASLRPSEKFAGVEARPMKPQLVEPAGEA